MAICYKLVKECEGKFVSWGYKELSKKYKKWMLKYTINKSIIAPKDSYLFVYEDIKYAEINGSLHNDLENKKSSLILKCETEDEFIYPKWLSYDANGLLYDKFWKEAKIVNKNQKNNLIIDEKFKDTLKLDKPKGTVLVKSLKPLQYITIPNDVAFYVKKYND